jgi:glycerol kinase
MSKKYILALDQGTTSSRAIIFNKKQEIIAIEQEEYKLFFPEKSWVEQRPEDIWQSIYSTVKKVLFNNNISSDEIASIGITNQRETTIVWNKKTGKPIHNAIVWQDTRTADYCKEIAKDYSQIIKQKTGLIIDPYFSATKLKWILDRYDKNRKQSENGELLFGTVDTWLLWKLTDGKVHATDASNASRTMLYNISEKRWSSNLLKIFNIPSNILPEVKDSSALFGFTHIDLFSTKISITAMIGDQQSALYGQKATEAGMVKNTFGTGGFMLMNTGNKLVKSTHGLLSTIAWQIKGKVTYALEGSVFISGAVVQWLRDELGLIKNVSETDAMAHAIKDNNGVYFVPAFSGLGAPYWNKNALGLITGLSRDTNKYHIVRAALEAMAFQTKDVLNAMITDSNLPIISILVDGGAVKNNFLMQFLADILDTEIIRPKNSEATAFGAFLLAGLYINFFDKLENINNSTFTPVMNSTTRKKLYSEWLKAIEKVNI